MRKHILPNVQTTALINISYTVLKTEALLHLPDKYPFPLAHA